MLSSSICTELDVFQDSTKLYSGGSEKKLRVFDLSKQMMRSALLEHRMRKYLDGDVFD